MAELADARDLGSRGATLPGSNPGLGTPDALGPSRADPARIRAAGRDAQAAIEAAGALLVHAAAVRAGRGALLCVAPSGGGKSTFAAQFPFPAILADERILLTPRAEGWAVAPPPRAFRGSRIGKEWDPVPLRAILLPGRGPGISLRRCPPAAALARLASQTFTLAQEEGGYEPHLARCREVAERIPAAHLAFTPPAALAPAIEAWLAAGA